MNQPCRDYDVFVVPLIWAGELIGVFDIDSPEPGRFDTVDQDGLESVAGVFVESLTPRRELDQNLSGNQQ